MESRPLVVVGAGLSGTAAAIEAAKAGVQVTLIDENPIGMSMIGLDVPQFFGQRIVGTLRNKGVMLGRVAANPTTPWRRRKKPASTSSLERVCGAPFAIPRPAGC